VRGLTPPGGIVVRDDVLRPTTAGWRTNGKPVVELAKCIDCLLCWVYCPDSAIRLDGTAFAGFEYGVCKGCELCAAVCPTGAIVMAPEDDDA
jgi:2-oxoacid:acceptor oxidoreductase delta subunit (pyruvate/2-ketoisovalerate family)